MACRSHGACPGWAPICSWLLLGVMAGLGAAPQARAADAETRDFTVLVDNKPAGAAHMTITKQDDGTTTMDCQTDVKVTVLLYTYTYSYHGREVWKDSRLQRFDSNCDDNRKHYQVSAIAETGGVRVRVNNQERMVRPEVWLTSYWTLPDPKIRDQAIPLLDADNGRDLVCRIQYVGAGQMAVAGQIQNVQHYRLLGKVNIDVWYDASERLVRQEWVEDGHPTRLELSRIRR
jgi:hypothetical protein